MPPPPATMSGVIGGVVEGLRFIAPSFLGIKHLKAEYTPPRFVWAITQDDFNGPSMLGGNPRALFEMKTTWVVHCWAKVGPTPDTHYDLARNMRDALVTALHNVTGGNYGLGPAQWTEGDTSRLGIVVTQTIVLISPLVEQTLPTTSAAPSGGGVQKSLSPAQDNTHSEVVPEKFGFDTDKAVDPDGDLTAGET
jgi:hypothetical protein